MTTFLGVEAIRQKVHVAILKEGAGEAFKINKRSLKARIQNLTRSGIDTSEEEKALKALEEASEQNDIQL